MVKPPTTVDIMSTGCHVEAMTGGEALRAIQDLASAGRLRFGQHALEDSLPDDGVFVADIQSVLENAREVLAQDDEGLKWKAVGPLPKGEDYAVVVNVYESYLFVVTCHYPP
jgi:hypothetical protein